jgi:hypothetical protein
VRERGRYTCRKPSTVLQQGKRGTVIDTWELKERRQLMAAEIMLAGRRCVGMRAGTMRAYTPAIDTWSDLDIDSPDIRHTHTHRERERARERERERGM